MNQSDERTGLDPHQVHRTATVGGVEEEEPPGKPKRHPLWRSVPARSWNDWRWQSQNAIRSVRQLRDLLPFTPEEIEAIGSLEAEYKLAIPPYYFSLINVDDPNDPIRVGFRIRNAADGRRVITDMEVEGVWLALWERADFTSFLQQHGGKIGALTDNLRAQAQQISADFSSPK